MFPESRCRLIVFLFCWCIPYSNQCNWWLWWRYRPRGNDQWSQWITLSVLNEGQVLHRAPAHFNFPRWSFVWSALQTKVDYVLVVFEWIQQRLRKDQTSPGSIWSNLKSSRMIDSTAWKWGWVEFNHSFLSVTSVVLNVNQFFGFSDGLLKQQKQDNHVFQKCAIFHEMWLSCFCLESMVKTEMRLSSIR